TGLVLLLLLLLLLLPLSAWFARARQMKHYWLRLWLRVRRVREDMIQGQIHLMAERKGAQPEESIAGLRLNEGELRDQHGAATSRSAREDDSNQGGASNW